MQNSATHFDRLTEEFDRLTLEQANALRSASITGMTPEDVMGYDTRCKRIMRLVKELEMLQKSQRVPAAVSSIPQESSWR